MDTAFLNPRKRPDLLVLADATISTVATEQIDDVNELSSMNQILLIELKRGDSEISRDNVNQACNYVEDLLSCGLIDGEPYIRAFVVGHRASDKMQTVRKIGDNPERGKVCVTTYNQLVRTANKRLFKLKDQLSRRYEELSTPDLLGKILSEPLQMSLGLTDTSENAPSTEERGRSEASAAMTLSQLTEILRNRRALIVHFSHTAKEGASLLFPDDLNNAMQIIADKELSCSVVWPRRCAAVGSVGIALRPRSFTSVTSASAVDAGTIEDSRTGHREGLGKALTCEILKETLEPRTPNYNEWTVRDADIVGIFVDLASTLEVAKTVDAATIEGYDPTAMLHVGPTTCPCKIALKEVFDAFLTIELLDSEITRS